MSSKDNHYEWFGTREVVYRENPCGFCREADHKRCAHEIAWFDKLLICGCSCNKTWKPQDVTVAKKTKEGK